MLRFASLLCATALASCGLISDDVDDFALRMPPQPFRLDSADWDLPPSASFPAVACTAGGDQCGQARSSLCGDEHCTVDCNAIAGTCQASVAIDLMDRFDLAEDGPGYAELDQKMGVAITIDEIYFEIQENTLNVSTPQLSIYMAPLTVTEWAAAESKLIGTVAPIPPGVVGKREIDLTTGGEATVQSFIDKYTTPFNVFIVGRIDLDAGAPVPEGHLVGTLQVDAHADVVR